ncbi:MFS general substrate transporter [Gautieria morchelliformis]|nr:MFS general substrate transporter [Gautieria morchelliformis]
MDTQPTHDKSKDPPAAPPDGGARAWCTVLGGWLALFATFGYTSSFGVYQDLYTRSGTSSSSNISWIGSVQLFLFLGMGLPAGRLLDKGYFRHCVLVGSFIYMFSLFMLSIVSLDHYYQIFLSQGVGMGIGSGLIYLPAMGVQAHHWKARRSIAMGVVITGSSFGGMVYPVMLNHLFHGPVGFAWGVRASAFLTGGILVAANLLMSSRLPSKMEQRRTPKPNIREIVTDMPYLLYCIGISFVVWGLFFPYFYLQLYSISHGIPASFAFYTLTIQSGASILGRTLPGFIADKLGPINVCVFMSFGTGVTVFALFGIANLGGVVVFAILYGFFSGGILAMLSPAVVSFARDIPEIGIRMGLAYFMCSFAFLTGAPIAGALLNNGTPWFKPIIFSGVCGYTNYQTPTQLLSHICFYRRQTLMLLGVPFIWAARAVHAKRKGSPYV